MAVRSLDHATRRLTASLTPPPFRFAQERGRRAKSTDNSYWRGSNPRLDPRISALYYSIMVMLQEIRRYADRIVQEFSPERIVLFGSYAARADGLAGEPPNDIDLMVLGTPDEAAVYAACRRVGDVVGRPVNPVIMTTDEWEDDSAFLKHVRANPVVPVVRSQP